MITAQCVCVMGSLLMRTECMHSSSGMSIQSFVCIYTYMPVWIVIIIRILTQYVDRMEV